VELHRRNEEKSYGGHPYAGRGGKGRKKKRETNAKGAKRSTKKYPFL